MRTGEMMSGRRVFESGCECGQQVTDGRTGRECIRANVIEKREKRRRKQGAVFVITIDSSRSVLWPAESLIERIQWIGKRERRRLHFFSHRKDFVRSVS